VIAKNLPSLKANFIILLYVRLYMVVNVNGTREKGESGRNESVKMEVCDHTRKNKIEMIVYNDILSDWTCAKKATKKH